MDVVVEYCKFCQRVIAPDVPCEASPSGACCVAKTADDPRPGTTARGVSEGLRRLAGRPRPTRPAFGVPPGLGPLMEALEGPPPGAVEAARAQEAFGVAGRLLSMASRIRDPEIMENVANLGRALAEVGLHAVDEVLEDDEEGEGRKLPSDVVMRAR